MRTIKYKLAVAICAMVSGITAAMAAELPLAARSWGGVVRSAAGGHSARIASLKEGDAVTILAHTGTQWNGYDWFKIRYHGARIGYQWGGILCPIGKAIKGTFEVCQASGPMAGQK